MFIKNFNLFGLKIFNQYSRQKESLHQDNVEPALFKRIGKMDFNLALYRA